MNSIYHGDILRGYTNVGPEPQNLGGLYSPNIFDISNAAELLHMFQHIEFRTHKSL